MFDSTFPAITTLNVREPIKGWAPSFVSKPIPNTSEPEELFSYNAVDVYQLKRDRRWIGGQGRPLWNKLPVTKGGVWHWPSQLASLYLTRQHWCQNGTLGLWYCGYFIIKLQYLNEPTSEINACTLWLPSQSQFCVLFCEGYMGRIPESKSSKSSYKNCI